MKTLILFWHGLGDNILATPAIKLFKLSTGDYLGWTTLKRFRSARLFQFNPYIDRIHYVSDAWNDFDSYEEGVQAVTKEAYSIADRCGYDRVVVVNHKSSKKHKILRTAEELGVDLCGDYATETYLGNDADKDIALPDKFYFFHGRTGLSIKDLPLGFVRNFIAKMGYEQYPIVSPDFTWKETDFPILLSAQCMKRAQGIFVADSVMYHMAHSLGLSVDLAYFARGPEVWRQVRPLHTGAIERHILFDLRT